MFPPPQPWKQVVDVDPERTYVGFTSRFFLRSWLRAPSFVWRSVGVYRQASAASGIVGFSLGGDLPRLEFHTLSAWEDDASLRAFVRAAQHREVTERFSEAMRAPSLFVRFAVRGSELPLLWDDALARQRERLAARAA